jgi:4-hydroxy-3-polyprenylbenzoate decarboxylase
MTKISQWGGVVIPASPGFYNKPESIDDLIDFVVARILDQLGIENNLTARWTGEEIESNE